MRRFDTCWVYADPRKRYSREVGAALAVGSGGRLIFDWQPRLGTAIVSGMALAQQRVLSHPLSRDWWQVDHGYWRRGEYYRLSHRRLWCDGLGEPDYARLDALRVAIAPPRTSGRHVLIAMQSAGFYRLWVGGVDHDAYQRHLVERVRQRTDRPIVCRLKPLGGVREPPLAEQLADAWLVVTHSSAVALDALAAGVPVIVTEPTFCAARLGTPWERVENPYRPSQDERRDLFARIAGHQWTLAEMRSGEVWERLRQ